MYCKNCGAQLTAGANFCGACGTEVTTPPVSPAVEKPAKPTLSGQIAKLKKRTPVSVALVLAVVMLCVLFQIVRFWGYKPLVTDYFTAMESSDREAVFALYSWDYVQENNERIINQYSAFPAIQDPTMFTSDSLDTYVYNNDKYYRFLFGDAIESWEITSVSRNYLSFDRPQIIVEVCVVFEHSSEDVIARMELEKGNEGWYLTSVNAGYPPDKDGE